MLERRLDRFPIKEPLMDKIDSIRKWVGSGGISDHSPIFLEVSSNSPKLCSPFKVNVTWLRDDEFQRIIKEAWQASSQIEQWSMTKHLARNLICLKKRTIEWEKEKKKKEEETLCKIQFELVKLEDSDSGGYDTPESNSISYN